MRSCCVFDCPRLLHVPLSAVYLLSYRPVFLPGHQLLLPRCGGQIPCALQLMRTLAPLPSTTLSLWEPTPTRSVDLGKHSVYTHFPKDRNCEICQRTKITRSPCRRRIGGAVPRAGKIGDLITADHKDLSESCESRNNHRYAVVVQDLTTWWIQSYPCKTKTSLETQKGACRSSWSRIGSLKSLTLPIPWNLAKLVKIFPWNHCTSTPHTSETKWDCWKSSAQSERRHICSIVAIRSGWKLVGKFDGILYLSSKHTRSVVWWENTPYERRFGTPFEGRIIPFGSLVEYCPILAKDQSIIHHFGKNVLPGLFLGYALYAGENLEEWHISCRHWGVGNDGRIRNLLWKTQCKGRNISQRKWKIHFSSRWWTNQTSWRRSGTENIHLDTASTNSRRKSRRFSWRIRRVSFTTSRLTSGCQWSDKWFLVHVRKLHKRPSRWPRVNLYSPREESLLVPLKYIDVSRTTRTNLEVMQERRIDDYWIIDGSRALSDYWRGFTQFVLLEEKPPDGYMWSGRDWPESS